MYEQGIILKVLVVGKCDVSHLVESLTDAFVDSGYQAEYFNIKKYRRIDKYIYSNFTVKAFDKKLKNYNPDLIFIVAPLFVSMPFYKVIEEHKTKTRTIVAGWIGDVFNLSTDSNEQKLSLFDKIFITDSGFDNLLENKFKSTYLPLAANPKIFQFSDNHKINQAIFVGSMTKHREYVLSRLNTKVKIIGNGWDKKKLPQHEVIMKSCSIYETASLYKSHAVAINIKNEHNVINGLNQRSFDPIACGCLLVHDYIDDLNLNFDINKEILIYQDVEYLDDMLTRIFSDLEFSKNCKKNIQNGYNRVQNNHYFSQRIEMIVKEL